MKPTAVVVYHRADIDGHMSAAIMRRYLAPNHEVHLIGADYQDNIDRLIADITFKIDDDSTLAILDFCLPLEHMQILSKLYKLIWIDHHEVIDEHPYSKLECEGMRLKSRAACQLTWDYCYPGDEIPIAVNLAGWYDSWQWRTNPAREDIISFQSGMKTVDWRVTESKVLDSLLDGDLALMYDIIDKGETIKDYETRQNERACNNAYPIEWEGYECLALNTNHANSETFTSRPGYDIYISYRYNGKRWVVSLYSATVNVAGVAKRYGGGGHRGAAGFDTDTFPF